VIVKFAGDYSDKPFKIAAPSAAVKCSVWDCDTQKRETPGCCLQLKSPGRIDQSLMFDRAQDESKGMLFGWFKKELRIEY
jgi:hypothetical protein